MNLPSILLKKHGNSNVNQRFRCDGVAENAMFDPVMKRLQDCRWRFKIHIRHPQGKNIAVFVFVPFQAGCVAAIYNGMKIEGIAVIGHENPSLIMVNI